MQRCLKKKKFIPCLTLFGVSFLGGVWIVDLLFVVAAADLHNGGGGSQRERCQFVF